MKKEMSSFDVRSVVNDMEHLVGSHMDKIFQWGSNLLFRVNVSGEGKRDIFFKGGKWVYLPGKKPETPFVSQSFAVFLRKYIDNARIGKICQIGFDRVISMEVLKANCDYKIVFEMFGGGNVLLVLNGKIVNCLVCKNLKDRNIKPGEIYIPPKSRFDPISSSLEEFIAIVEDSNADVVRTLATSVNLGGQYAEEVCVRSGIPKNTKIRELDTNSVKKLFDFTKEIVSESVNSSTIMVYRNEKEIVDITPIEMNIYSCFNAERYDSFSEAMDIYVEGIERRVNPEIVRLQKRIDKQKEAVMTYREDAKELADGANAIYANYQQIDELLKVLFIESQKLSWNKLKENAMKIPFVSKIDPSKNCVTVIFDDLKILLNYTKNIDANASDLYTRSKEVYEKASRADLALKESIEIMNRKQTETDVIKTSKKPRPTKQFWFERYKWFVLSSGKMVIAGRDAHTNDDVVKKHMKDGDIYVHADLHGAPSTILKGGGEASDEELREACMFALAHSKAWVANLSDGNAYWVHADQVSKTPQAGEFIPRGAFVIRGRRNYVSHLPLELAVGEIKFEDERKIMCGPLVSVLRHSERYRRYFIIRPGKNRVEETAALIANEFQVPEEEVSRILPPGNSVIFGRMEVKPENQAE